MLVSAVMPTADRRHLVPQAIDSFLSQTWEEKELWVLDDGQDLVADLIPRDSGVAYYAIDGSKPNIPAKRNMVNGKARGRVIIHWDDDDWSAPDRMQSQVEYLLATGVDLVGYHRMHFWDVVAQQAYAYRSTQHVWACGTSFCYWKRFWELNPYDESIDLSTDNIFCRAARIRKNLATETAGQAMVARVHSRNTNPKNLGADNFKKIGTGDLNPGFPLN